LEHAQLDILSEIYQYRTRVGDYVPRKVQRAGILEQVEQYLLQRESGGDAHGVHMRAAARQLKKQDHAAALDNTRRACFARNLSDIHSTVLNSELKVDSFEVPTQAFAKNLQAELYDSTRDPGTAGASKKPGKTARSARAAYTSLESVNVEELPNAVMDDILIDDGLNVVTAEDFVKFRLQPAVSYLSRQSQLLGHALKALQVLIFLMTGATAAFAMLDLQAFVPLLITFATVLNGIMEFEQCSTRLRNVNAALLTLKNTYTWWHSLSMVEKRLPVNKDYMVRITESTRDAEISAWMKGKGQVRKPKDEGGEDENQEDQQGDNKGEKESA